MDSGVIVAIDGPAGAGKGTIARYLASSYQLRLLETGLLYRLLGYHAFIQKIPLEASSSLLRLAVTLDFTDLSAPELRQEWVGNLASKISVWPEVREFLTGYMRRFCQKTALPYRGVILDGRDIGTVVCPDATLKFFITASPEVRAQRRALEMEKSSFHDKVFLAQVSERDQRDQSRTLSPLTMAEDAYQIDTTNLTVQESCHQAAKIVQAFLDKDFEFPSNNKRVLDLKPD